MGKCAHCCLLPLTHSTARSHLRYFMTWFILLAVLLSWWNSSIAAGGSLLTAQELKTLFSDLLQLIQREDALLRAEVVSLNDNSRRTRDELRQELAEVRRDMIAVLLNEGRGGAWGGGGGRQLMRMVAGGGGGGGGWRGGDEDGGGGGGWLSSLAEKTGLKGGGGGGGGGWGREKGDRERGGDGELGPWDAGFMSGLRAQLINLAGGDSGANDKAVGQTQSGGAGEGQAVDDRYKAAMVPQWTEGRKDDKREER